MKINVHPNTECLHSQELLDKLEHYGYEFTDVRREADFVIDARNPEYRGIRSVISYFDTKHHDKWVEWNGLHSNKVCSIVQEEDDTCYT